MTRSALAAAAALVVGLSGAAARADCKTAKEELAKVTKQRDIVSATEERDAQQLTQMLAKSGELGLMKGGYPRNTVCNDIKDSNTRAFCKTFKDWMMKRKDLDVQVERQADVVKHQCG